MPLHSRITNAALEQQIKLQELCIATEWSASCFGYLVVYYPGYRQIQTAKMVASSTVISGRACLRQLVGSLALAAHAHVRHQTSTRAIYSGQRNNATRFSPSTPILPCQYHCTSVHIHISLSSYRCCIIVSWHKIFLAPNFNFLEKLCVRHVNIKFLTACFMTAFNCFSEEVTRGML